MPYFTNDFVPSFPKDVLINKQEAIKAAKQLYRSKGTPASYDFLFRILYNSPADIFNTKDAILRASAGTWYVARSLRLLTTDPNWLTLTNALVGNYRVFGMTSKSVATIENVTKLGTDKTEVFISAIERQFVSGEDVLVIDRNNQPVTFNNNELIAKIVGQVNQINIDPNNRGLFY